MPVAVTSTITSTGLVSSAAMVIPTGALADDILVLSVLTRSSAALSVVEDSGAAWTEKARHDNTASMSVWWRRAATDPSGSTVHVNGGANSLVAAMVSFSGCVTSGDPWSDFESTIASGTSNASMTAVTADSSGAGVVLFAGESDDRALSTMTAGGTPSSLARIAHPIHAIGLDAALVVGFNSMASSGNTGTFTWSWAAAVQHRSHAGVLAPVGGAPPPVENPNWLGFALMGVQ